MNAKTVRVGACVYAGDMDTMARFYRDTLGLATDWDGGDFAEFETASGKLALFMYSKIAFAQAIGEEYARLSKLGVRFPTGAPQTFSFGIRNFYVADPEGNLLEIGSLHE